jgi:5-methylcytosine-specific restriction endonuclease McrA
MARPGTTRRQQANHKRILAASDICHICGHAGADEVDHVTAVARGGSNDLSNLKPAHGQQPCGTCGVRCNRVKSDKLFAPIVRRSGSLN